MHAICSYLRNLVILWKSEFCSHRFSVFQVQAREQLPTERPCGMPDPSNSLIVIFISGLGKCISSLLQSLSILYGNI